MIDRLIEGRPRPSDLLEEVVRCTIKHDSDVTDYDYYYYYDDKNLGWTLGKLEGKEIDPSRRDLTHG
jgi:hypothetical protein